MGAVISHAKTGSKKLLDLNEGLGSKNALGLLRFVFASLVIVSHGFPLGGFEYPWDESQRTDIGGIAVLGFFAISGYLITKSGLANDVMQFMWHRILRIFPAFWVVLVISAFVVGPAIWVSRGLDFSRYFEKPLPFAGTSPQDYVLGNFFLKIQHYDIYDLFASNPYPLTINGSLWTLFYEWECYLLIAIILGIGAMRFSRVLIPVLTILFVLGDVLNTTTPGTLPLLLPDFLVNEQFLRLGSIFMMGSCFAIFSQKIKVDGRIALVSFSLFLTSWWLPEFHIVGYPALAYLVLFLGAWLPANTHWIGQKNDYSYGIYIYGFVVQQVLASLLVPSWGYFPYVSLSLTVSFCLAWLSWHLVEKRVMGLKKWGPGRGIQFWAHKLNLQAKILGNP